MSAPYIRPWIRGTTALAGLFLMAFYLWSDESALAGQNLFVVCSVPFFAVTALFAQEFAAPELAGLYSALGYAGILGHLLYVLFGGA